MENTRKKRKPRYDYELAFYLILTAIALFIAICFGIAFLIHLAFYIELRTVFPYVIKAGMCILLQLFLMNDVGNLGKELSLVMALFESMYIFFFFVS